jgi:ribosome recycling factor
VKSVANAIQECGLALNPVIENNLVSVFIPKPSKESREVLVKTASRMAEKVSFIHVVNHGLLNSH